MQCICTFARRVINCITLDAVSLNQLDLTSAVLMYHFYCIICMCLYVIMVQVLLGVFPRPVKQTTQLLSRLMYAVFWIFPYFPLPIATFIISACIALWVICKVCWECFFFCYLVKQVNCLIHMMFVFILRYVFFFCWQSSFSLCKEWQGLIFPWINKQPAIFMCVCVSLYKNVNCNCVSLFENQQDSFYIPQNRH